ncbi:ZIP family metal transporter [Patescibacteria group bacterium]|nr:ZIP family metal transporter [Patescibacteria group bacterium]
MFFNTLFFSLLAGLTTLAGVYLMAKKAEWAQKNLIYLISFSAGVLLSFSFTHLIPESLELYPGALVAVLLSFLAFYVLEHSLSLHICKDKEHCEAHETFTLVSWVGLLVHSLIDGVVIGAGFEASFVLGIISTLAVLLHELPEGISSMAIMLYGKYPVSKAVGYSSLVALATPLGAVISLFALRGVSESFVGLLLAVAAGSFLYVAASDLIPEIHRKSKTWNIALTFIGVTIPFLVSRLIG